MREARLTKKKKKTGREGAHCVAGVGGTWLGVMGEENKGQKLENMGGQVLGGGVMTEG